MEFIKYKDSEDVESIRSEENFESDDYIQYYKDLKRFIIDEFQEKQEHHLNFHFIEQKLKTNNDLLSKFTSYFSTRFRIILKENEFYSLFENSYKDKNISKIVPQISFVFKMPSLGKHPFFKLFISDTKNKQRTKNIRFCRENHKTDKMQISKKTSKEKFWERFTMALKKTFLSKFKVFSKIKLTYQKIKKVTEKIEKYKKITDYQTVNSEKFSTTESLLENFSSPIGKFTENFIGKKEIFVDKLKSYYEDISIKKIDEADKHPNSNDKSNNISNKIKSKVSFFKFQNRNSDISEAEKQNKKIESNIDHENKLNEPLISKTTDKIPKTLIEVFENNKFEKLDRFNERFLIKNQEKKISLFEETNHDETETLFFDANDYSLPLDKKDERLYINLTNLTFDRLSEFLEKTFDKLDYLRMTILKESIIKKFKEERNSYIEFSKEEINGKLHLYLSFISIFSNIINYFTGLKFKYFIDGADCFNIDFYLDEKGFCEYSKLINYKLQYRIIAEKYYNDKKNFSENKNFLNSFQKLIEKNSIKHINLDENDISHHPPFTSYKGHSSERNNLRRYLNDKADEYHLCNDCVNVQKEEYFVKCNSSYFKHIDKQRIISHVLNHLLDFYNIKNKIAQNENNMKEFLLEILYVHNYKAYEEKFHNGKIINSCLSLFENKQINDLNNDVRKLIGEEFGFYYVWISHYIKLLIFPAIIGCVVWFLNFVLKEYYGQEKFDQLKLDLFLLLPFSCLIIIWSKFYYKSWNEEEKFYRYIWGMREFFLDETIISEETEKFLDIIIPKVNNLRMMILKICSWAVTIIMLFLTISIDWFIFWLQGIYLESKKPVQLGLNFDLKSTKEIYNYNLFWIYLVPVLMFFTRELMTDFYYKISEKLTQFEENVKFSEYRKSFILKASVFQFFNYYFNLYYIAFFKRYYEKCSYGNCKDELSNQLTVILITAVINDLKGLIISILFLYQENTLAEKLRNLMNIKHEKKKLIERRIHSEEDSFKSIKSISKIEKEYNIYKNGSNKDDFYKREIYQEKNADKEFVQIIMCYGYIIQFGTSSPICFLLALIHALIARLNDIINMTHYSHVNLVDGSPGLGSHSKIISILTTIGLITNVTINLFVDDRVLDMDSTQRWLILFLVENALLILVTLIKFDNLPSWFEYKNKAKFSYATFFELNKDIFLKEKIKKKFRSSKLIINAIKKKG